MRREWFIGLDENGFGRWLSEHKNFAPIGEHKCVEIVNAVEIKPGEIVLSRREVFRAVHVYTANQIAAENVVKELFGERE